MGEDRDREEKPAFTESYGEAKPAFSGKAGFGEAKEKDMNGEKEPKPKGLTRREFLRRAGAMALGVAAGLVLPDLGKA